MTKDRELENQYKKLDGELVDFHNKVVANGNYETKPLIPIKIDRTVYEQELADLGNKVKTLTYEDPVLDILHSHFKDFIQSQEAIIRKRFERPSEHITMFNNIFRKTVRADSRPEDYRCDLLIKVNSQADEIWKGILTWIDDVNYLYLNELIASCKLYIETMSVEVTRIPQYFPSISRKQRQMLTDSINALCNRMLCWIDFTEKLIKSKGFSKAKETSEDDTIPFEESYYRALLNDEYGVNLDELLSWYEEEVSKTRDRVFKAASKLKMPDSIPTTMKEVDAILLKYAGPCSTPEEMYKRANNYIKRTRAVAHEFLRLPDDEVCLVRETPEQYKFSWPWGGSGGVFLGSKPLTGEMFLNRRNYAFITDGWIKMNTVHEAYPGHHCQDVRRTIDPIPKTLKVGAKSIPLTEGSAHRSEIAFEFIFGEDQFYPLFTAYRRHHTAVRIKSDLMLRYFGRPIGEAVNLYRDELDFEYRVARGQVKQQEEMQGYFTCYYYGVKKLEDWEREYHFDKKSYTELLFSPGRLSLNNFGKFLKLNEEDKKRFLNDFGEE